VAEDACEEKEIPVFARRCISSSETPAKAAFGAPQATFLALFSEVAVASCVGKDPALARLCIFSMLNLPGAGFEAAQDALGVIFGLSCTVGSVRLRREALDFVRLPIF
jgi:hypothetical protein